MGPCTFCNISCIGLYNGIYIYICVCVSEYIDSMPNEHMHVLPRMLLSLSIGVYASIMKELNPNCSFFLPPARLSRQPRRDVWLPLKLLPGTSLAPTLTIYKYVLCIDWLR